VSCPFSIRSISPSPTNWPLRMMEIGPGSSTLPAWLRMLTALNGCRRAAATPDSGWYAYTACPGSRWLIRATMVLERLGTVRGRGRSKRYSDPTCSTRLCACTDAESAAPVTSGAGWSPHAPLSASLWARAMRSM